MQQALEDDHLRDALRMKIAQQQPEGLNVETFRDVIDNATAIGEFVDYNSSFEFARGVDRVVDSIAQLLDEGHAAEVIELTEHALLRCEEALGMVDDSAGEVGGVLERLQELHYAACMAAKPDPEELARRLFHWKLTSQRDVFYCAVEHYARVLGAKGLAVYRQLAESAWEKVPARGSRDKHRSLDDMRYRLTSMMESLARADGDVESLVAVQRRDLSSSYRYLQIAETYKQAGEADQALRWAEDGLKAFPDESSERLREFLAEEYHRRERHDDALAMIWANFAQRADLHHYRELQQHATRAKAWKTWREKAVTHIRGDIGRRSRAARVRGALGLGRVDHSTLVDIFLWEKDTEAAWREAQTGGCSDQLWMRLAKQRETHHPSDALGVYQQQVDSVINLGSGDAYRDAVALIRKIGELMRRVGRAGDFAGYVATLRATHRRKRNFVALLDRVKTDARA